MKPPRILWLLAVFGAVNAFALSPKAEWQAFRRAYPLHIQTLAISGPQEDGRRILILAEPPPHVTLDDIKHVGVDLGNISVQEHPLGYGGWVRDIVCTVPGDLKAANAIVSRLYGLFFGTRYKAYALALPIKASPTTPSLDLKVSYLEVQSWLSTSEGGFDLLTGGSVGSLDDLAHSEQPIVAFRHQPGLVVLWIPKGTALDQHRGVLRQFALDSDLIVGAQRLANGLVITARERVVPIEALPPLRAETIILLSQVRKAELAQSYERNHPLAGRIDKQKDWAPILLSAELRDTEYGSLLNITDQLLKGWSNNGLTRYENFTYPEPANWFFDAPLPKHLEIDEVTYNWNTTGAGYAVKTGNVETYALNRTAVLPVSYIPGADDAAARDPSSQKVNKLRSAEETAYEGFAGTQDPNLARVVQYAALYQIFRWANSHSTREDSERRDDDESKLLDKFFVDFLVALGQNTDAQDKALFAEVKGLLKRIALEGAEENELLALVAVGWAQLRELVSGEDRETVAKLARMLELPDAFLSTQLNKAQVEMMSLARLALAHLAAASGLHERYSQEVNRQTKARWIHTPAIVISAVRGELAAGSGGHNLDSTISRFRMAKSVSKGTVKVETLEGATHIVMHPDDAGRVAQIVRTSGQLRKSPEALAEQINRMLPKIAPAAVRSMAQALNLPPNVGGNKVRGFASASADDPVLQGWHTETQPSNAPIVAEFKRIEALQTNAILMERNSDGITIVTARDGHTIVAASREDAMDAVVTAMHRLPADAKPVYVNMTGFSPQEGIAMVQTLRIRNAKKEFRGRALERGHVSETLVQSVRDLDFAKASTTIKAKSGKTGYDLTVEIPRSTSPEQAHYHVSGIFRRQLEDSKFAAIVKSSVQKAKETITKVSSEESERAAIFDDINESLRSVARESGEELQSLQARLKLNAQDVYIVINIPPNHRTDGLAEGLRARSRNSDHARAVSE